MLHICNHVVKITDFTVLCIRHQENIRISVSTVLGALTIAQAASSIDAICYPFFDCLLCSWWLAGSIYFTVFIWLYTFNCHIDLCTQQALLQITQTGNSTRIVNHYTEHNAQHTNQTKPKITPDLVALKTGKPAQTFLQNMSVFKIFRIRKLQDYFKDTIKFCTGEKLSLWYLLTINTSSANFRHY